jgi:4-hydroxy-3-methylbut-2-enyl diphosphate reductase
MLETGDGRRVLLAAPRGFCAGVKRAVQTVEEALATFGAPVYVRRQIVHNAHVIARLQGLGAVFVEETDQVPDDAVLVLAAHGVSPAVREAASTRGRRVIDGTCPLVTKIHRETRRFAADGYSVILIGEPSHDEVTGTRDQAPGQVIVVSSPAEIDSVVVPDERRVAWVSQSTLAAEHVADMVRLLRRRFPELADPPSDDICYAVSHRQAVARAIAGRSDLVLVAGSRTSHNARQLVSVALGAGARAGRLVESAAELTDDCRAGVRTVGVASGASTPEFLVREVLDWLSARGYSAVEEVVSTVETQAFAAPRGLRPGELSAAVPGGARH